MVGGIIDMVTAAEIRKHNKDLLQRITGYAKVCQTEAKSIQTRPTLENIQNKIHCIEMANQKMRLCADQLW